MVGSSHRLTLRIYLVSLAQLVAIVGVTALVAKLMLAPPSLSTIARQMREVTAAVRERVGERAAMRDELRRIRTTQAVKVTVYDATGQVFASNVSPPLPKLSAAEIADLGFGEQLVHLHDEPDDAPPPRRHAGGGPAPSGFGHARPGHGHGHRSPFGPPLLAALVNVAPQMYAVLQPPPPSPPISAALVALASVLLVTGVTSVVLARSFARPLAQLSDVAGKLGQGDLTVRARLSRRDEFGQLAEAFDDMADRVAHLLRSQQELLANVSHELRTPLARIRVALDLAAEVSSVSPQEALGEIAEDLAELERLVTDVLQTARLDLAAGRAGRVAPTLRTERIDTRSVIDKAAERFRAAHPQRDLEVRVDPELPALDADAVLLRRALDNLLDNAQKYSEPNSIVVLRAEPVTAGVALSIQDFGIGIAADDLPKVATPFFRTDRSRARRTGGIGLGLSLARRIVEAHGGALHIDSQLSVGTTVRIIFPHAPQA